MLSHRTRLVFVLVLSVVALTGVGWLVAQGIDVSAEGAQQPAGGVTTERKTLAVGEGFELRLEGNPTTGYTWQASVDARCWARLPVARSGATAIRVIGSLRSWRAG